MKRSDVMTLPGIMLYCYGALLAVAEFLGYLLIDVLNLPTGQLGENESPLAFATDFIPIRWRVRECEPYDVSHESHQQVRRTVLLYMALTRYPRLLSDSLSKNIEKEKEPGKCGKTM